MEQISENVAEQNDSKIDISNLYKVCETMGQGYILVLATDCIRFRKIDDGGLYEELFKEKQDGTKLIDRATEVRVFNEVKEHKWFRSAINKEFGYRLRVDLPKALGDFFDEEQYLDIDIPETEKYWNDGAKKFRAIGGGVYELPVDEIAEWKLLVRNYIDYEEDTGRAYVCDWRLRGFVEEGENV